MEQMINTALSGSEKLSDLNEDIWNYMETWDIDGYCVNFVGRPGFNEFNEPTMTYNIQHNNDLVCPQYNANIPRYNMIQHIHPHSMHPHSMH